MLIEHITIENFEEEVLKEKRPVLVDFWASWCGPCKMMLPIVEELVEEQTQVKVVKVNVDEQPQLAEKYKIMSIPTLLVFKEGKIIDTSVGLKSKSEIQKMLTDL